LPSIRSEFNTKELREGNRQLIKSTFEKLISNEELLQDFFDSGSKNCDAASPLTIEDKSEIWRELLTKTFNARVGIMMDRFIGDTTGRFAANARTDSLRNELKIKSREHSVAKVEAAAGQACTLRAK
jgi:hypothetical protein